MTDRRQWYFTTSYSSQALNYEKPHSDVLCMAFRIHLWKKYIDVLGIVFKPDIHPTEYFYRQNCYMTCPLNVTIFDLYMLKEAMRFLLVCKLIENSWWFDPSDRAGFSIPDSDDRV